MEIPQPFVGIDVSAQRLDVDTLPASRRFSEPNNEDGIASLLLRLQPLNPKIVLLEATGGCEIPVAYALYEASLPVVIMNPKALRHFAKAIGRLAKTDKLDAQVLAHYARASEAWVSHCPLAWLGLRKQFFPPATTSGTRSLPEVRTTAFI